MNVRHDKINILSSPPQPHPCSLLHRLRHAFPAILTLLCATGAAHAQDACALPSETLHRKLSAYPHKIAYESFSDTNWDIWLMDADGANPKNLTQTRNIDELYPHATPDGRRICFLADRQAYRQGMYDIDVMDTDGANRKTLVVNGRQPAWNADGTCLAYMNGLDHPGSPHENEGLYFLDLTTGQTRRHPNQNIKNLLNLTWTPDNKWIVATVVAAMNYSQAILAIEVDGHRIVELTHQAGQDDIYGCRPDVSPDGKHLTWALEKLDQAMHVEVADLEYREGVPCVVNERHLATFTLPAGEAYHMDWSPDARYIAFSLGPQGSKIKTARYVIGAQAPGWNICAVEFAQPQIFWTITTNGWSNKEADWVPCRQ